MFGASLPMAWTCAPLIPLPLLSPTRVRELFKMKIKPHYAPIEILPAEPPPHLTQQPGSWGPEPSTLLSLFLHIFSLHSVPFPASSTFQHLAVARTSPSPVLPQDLCMGFSRKWNILPLRVCLATPPTCIQGSTPASPPQNDLPWPPILILLGHISFRLFSY